MRQSIWIAAVLGALGIGTLAFGDMHQRGEDQGLAALMQQNRQHFEAMVQTAYFEGVQRRLQAEDFQKIGEQAGSIAEIARQVEQDYSRGDGDEFDEIAGDLQEHAEKAGKAAKEQKHPELNIEIGEMAEYCAKCHEKFRW